jgi:hypothetical protein
MIHKANWLSKWSSYTKSKGYQHMNFRIRCKKDRFGSNASNNKRLGSEYFTLWLQYKNVDLVEDARWKPWMGNNGPIPRKTLFVKRSWWSWMPLNKIQINNEYRPIMISLNIYLFMWKDFKCGIEEEISSPFGIV